MRLYDSDSDIASRVVLRTVSMVYRYTCAMAAATDFIRVLPERYEPPNGIPYTMYKWVRIEWPTNLITDRSNGFFETQDLAVEDAHAKYPTLGITGRAGPDAEG